MKLSHIPFSSAALSLTALLSTFTAVQASPQSVEIPERLERRILAQAPQIDANGDGVITVSEIQSAYPHLPEDHQRVIRRHLPDITFTEESSLPQSNEAGVDDENWLLLGHSFFRPPAELIEEYPDYACDYDLDVLKQIAMDVVDAYSSEDVEQ